MDLDSEGTRETVLDLGAGESADVTVLQQGIDVVVEAYGPEGILLDVVDSPNGRAGAERISLFATQAGPYRVRIRPLSRSEPAGRVAVGISTIRTAEETRQLLETRRRKRAEAASWLRQRSVALPLSGQVEASRPLGPFDDIAAQARIIGLGEATHGSREFGDLRLSLVRRLVRRHGYRLVAVEDSSSRWRVLEPYVAGIASEPGTALEWGWIGRRSRRLLLEWVRDWNLDNPNDRVRIVGVDLQDNSLSREQLGRFMADAYGPDLSALWRTHAQELARTNEQTHIFGSSRTSESLRQFLQAILSQITSDGPLLRKEHGEEAYAAALAAARDLYGFVDFNTRGRAVPRSRDWYMAAGIVRAMGEQAPSPKTVFWAHNAHIAASADAREPAGALLRKLFGCRYRAVASTFGKGSFLVQVMDDPQAGLAPSTLSSAGDDSIERVLADVAPGAHLSAWSCDGDRRPVPEWIAGDRPLHSIGALYSPGSAAALSSQPVQLTTAFDAIGYFPIVAAEEIPPGRRAIMPLIGRPPTLAQP